jgi:hypothetical protein
MIEKSYYTNSSPLPSLLAFPPPHQVVSKARRTDTRSQKNGHLERERSPTH